ncbi:MAG: membrane protein [Nitrospira sp.]
MNVFTQGGDTNLVTKTSRYSVIETIDRIEKAVATMDMHVFARIDHGGEAKKAGLEMNPAMLLIFGNPKGGTPLMVARPTVAIDLPWKALAWEDGDGKVWLTYNTADLLHERHGLPKELAAKLDLVRKVLEQAVE